MDNASIKVHMGGSSSVSTASKCVAFFEDGDDTFEEGNDNGDERPAKRPRKRTCHNYDDTITVLVGPEKAKFTAHKDVLCARSGYFKVACSQRWKEGQESVVPLPEIEKETFQTYMDLVYNLPIFDDESESLPLVKFYVLGDFLDDVKARDKALGLLVAEIFCPSPETCVFIWDHTTSNFLLRQTAYDGVAARMGVIDFARKVKQYPADFVQQFAVKMFYHVPAGLPYPSARLQGFVEAGDEDEE